MDKTIGMVTTAYNNPALLKWHLKFLGNQSRPLNRLVIVDDASSDDAANENRRLCGSEQWYVNIDYNELKQYRRAQAMNAGISIIDTDMIIVSPQDIMYPVEFVDKCFWLMQNYINIVPSFKVYSLPPTVDLEEIYNNQELWQQHQQVPYVKIGEHHWSDRENLHMLPYANGFDGVYCCHRKDVQLYHPRWRGWGGDNSYIAWEFIRNNCYLVAMKDNPCYHIGHFKEPATDETVEQRRDKSAIADVPERLYTDHMKIRLVKG